MNTNVTQTAPNTATTANTQPERHQAQDQPSLLPPVDVVEDTTGITLYADMPGVPRDKLHLRVEGDQLHLEGDIVLPLAQDLASSHAEVTRSRFRRAFTLSKELDAAKVSAELTHGVLRVRIPKAEHAQPRKVEIRVA
jgi:HSP20 family protein